MGVFDILGPIMIGPSSSHTAGAARLGRMAMTILGEKPTAVTITLYGSFARTYRGHGTDKALIAGLLGFEADDSRISDAPVLAAEAGLKVEFKTATDERDIHPNTAEFSMVGETGKKVRVVGASIGGGRIVVNRIDDYEVEITGEYHTLVIIHRDIPGIIALLTHLLAQQSVNIANMRASRKQKGTDALMIIETDQAVSAETLGTMNSLPEIETALLVQPL